MPPSAVFGDVLSLMGRKMCVLLVKSGKAERSVVGSGVWFSMKHIEGLRRLTWAAGYRGRYSCSRYLSKIS